MNVYDFDKTIFTGDCEDYFFAYLFKTRGMRLHHIRYTIAERLFKLGLLSKTRSREIQYCFLKNVGDLDALLEDYWDQHEKYMMDWYLQVKQPTDVIATGSPRFLMEPILHRLGLNNMVATEMDRKTGKITGKFALYQYKKQYFAEQYDLNDIDNFYSDDHSDHFLAESAKHAYVVHDGGQVSEWYDYFETHTFKKPYIV